MITRMPISTCISGDKIAEDVQDMDGRILLRKNTVIDDKLKEDLVEIGISSLSIYNPITRFERPEKLNKLIVQEVRESFDSILLKKEYLYAGVTKYLSYMYESINNNSIIIQALNRIKNIDTYILSHSINTAFYSMFIAIWMGLAHKDIINATQAGLLHDIGKIYIPLEILNKRGPLTKEEYEIAKKHTLYGYFFLNKFSELNKEVKRAVLFHHERIDSLGYPLKASPDYVGIISKIVAVADTYDAMTTDRVYKKAVTPTEAISFLSSEGMKMLDNKVLNTFLQHISLYDFKA